MSLRISRKKSNKFQKNKKAQTAIFMVVALFIVLGGIYFFSTTRIAAQKIEPEVLRTQEQVPLEFDAVRSYANECVNSLGAEGLKIMGKQGGYISFTDKSLNRLSFGTSPNPTESEIVSFSQGSDLKIPYWYYLKSKNECTGDCEFASRRPDLRDSENSIEKQLERYIDMNFKECLSNFEPFVKEGYEITEKGIPKSDVIIGTEDITISVNYPINVKNGQSDSDISYFTTNIPVNLERVYELATKITNMEGEHHFIEKYVLNLIVAFSGLSRDRLPPMSEMEFKFGSTMSWQKSTIKKSITQMMTSYIPLFQVDGTYNFERNYFDSELKQRLYDGTIIPIANSSYIDLAAQFTYLDFWPIYLDLNCKGETCKPSSFSGVLPILGMQSYNFAYDLSYPVLVEVKDVNAFNGRGYTFSFFLEGNIRNNKFMDSNFDPLVVAKSIEKSQLCDIKESGEVAVNVKDSATKNPIEEAQVLYTVIDESCFIGSTDSKGVMKEKFPIAVGGAVNVIKQDYVGKSAEFDAALDKPDSVSVDMDPIFNKKIVVRKKNVVNPIADTIAGQLQGWKFEDKEINLSEKESATVTLTRIPDSTELDFSSVAQFEGQKEPAEIQIARGNYNIEITLVANQRIKIPKSEKCAGVWPLRKCAEIPEIDLSSGSKEGDESFPAGGLSLNVTFTNRDLMKNNTIVLYAVNIDIAGVPEAKRTIEDLEELEKIEEYSKKHSSSLQPKFE